MLRVTYAYGFKTFDAAQNALIDGFASGEISPGEAPEIVTYRTLQGALRWQITIPA
jgi:hypothetical protein